MGIARRAASAPHRVAVIQPTRSAISIADIVISRIQLKAVVARKLSPIFFPGFASGWVGECLSVVWHAGESDGGADRFYRTRSR